MYESISKNNELENEMTLDMSYFWYSDVGDVSVKGVVEGGDGTDWCTSLQWTVQEVGAFCDLVGREVCMYQFEVGFALRRIIQPQ